MLSSVIRVAPRIPLVIIRAFHLPSGKGIQPRPPRSGETQRILEREIKIFTVEAGKLADRVRTNPELQLHCVGGSASNTDYHPKQMQFVNAGADAQGKVLSLFSAGGEKTQLGWTNSLSELKSPARFSPGHLRGMGWPQKSSLARTFAEMSMSELAQRSFGTS